MPEIQFDPKLKTAWLRLQLVALAMLVTNIVYFVVCLLIVYVVEQGHFQGFAALEGSGNSFGLLRVLLLVISLPLVGVAFLARDRLRRSTVPLRRRPGCRVPETPEGDAVLRLKLVVMVSMTVAETPGVFGLTMFLISGGVTVHGVTERPGSPARGIPRAATGARQMGLQPQLVTPP